MAKRTKTDASRVLSFIAVLILAICLIPALASAADEVTVVEHNPVEHEQYCSVNSDYGPNTLCIKCAWEQDDPLEGHRACEFHDWTVLVVSTPDTFFDGQPKGAEYYWYTTNGEDPFSEPHEGIPAGMRIYSAPIYEGIDGTVEYGPTNEPPIGEGTYRVQVAVEIPALTSPITGETVRYVLENQFEILPSAYTVSFDANPPANSSTKDGVKGKMGYLKFNSMTEERQLYPNQFVLPGYTFAGWNTKPDGSGVSYGDGAIVSGLSQVGTDVTLYAQWQPRGYTITYVNTFETAEINDQVAYFDLQGTLFDPHDLWVYPDYCALHGWISPDSGLYYDDRALFCNLCTINYDGTLNGYTLETRYVHTDQIIVTVTKDGVIQEGVADSFTLIGANGIEYIVPASYEDGLYILDPTRATSPGGVPGDLPPYDYILTFENESAGLPRCQTELLYGEGVPSGAVLDYCTVRASVAEGDQGIDSLSIDGERELVLFEGTDAYLSAIARPGYHFVGYDVVGVKPAWWSDPSVAEQTITIRGTSEIIASSAPNSYTVHFDANTKRPFMGEMDDIEMTYDSGCYMPPNQFAVADGTFLGWNTEPDGSGKSFNDKGLLYNLTEEDGAEITLYAQWEIAKFTIKFVNDDGSELYSTVVEYGETPAYGGEEPTKAPDAENTYSFAGWDPVVIEAFEDATYTATYDATPVPPAPVEQGTLTFDLAGGTLDGKTGSITIVANVGDTVTIPDAPTREGYTFKYWKGSEYHPGDTYTVEGDHTFTAEWEKNEEPAPDPDPEPDPEPKPEPEIPKNGDATVLPSLAMLAASTAMIAGSLLARRKKH